MLSSPPPLLYVLSQASDWYSITLADLKNIGAPSTLRKVELAESLQERYPDFKWEKVFLLKGRYGQQRRLEHLLIELFPVCILCTLTHKTFSHNTSFSTFFYVQERGDDCECKEGSWFDSSWNPSTYGIGYLFSFPSSCIWISGLNPLPPSQSFNLTYDFIG